MINTKLTNNSNDTLKYYSMSCSYWDSYYLYDYELFFDDVGCNKNMPIVITLPPKESKVVGLKLRKSSKIDYSNIKIGFFLYKVNKDIDFKSDQINLKTNLLVSNSISF